MQVYLEYFEPNNQLQCRLLLLDFFDGIGFFFAGFTRIEDGLTNCGSP